MSKYRINVQTSPYGYLDYVVEEKGWIFWRELQCFCSEQTARMRIEQLKKAKEQERIIEVE